MRDIQNGGKKIKRSLDENDEWIIGRLKKSEVKEEQEAPT